MGDETLPNVVVTEVKVREAGDVLRAATYGWGMWQRRILPPLSPVDVYVRDNKMDTGETSPSPYDVVDPQVAGSKLYFWESPDIKTSLDSPPVDGVEFDPVLEWDPLRGEPNPLYVQVHNRGWTPATNVKVRALWADGAAGLPPLPADFWSTFPGNWSAASDWHPIDANLPFQTIPTLRPHTPAILNWTWVLPSSASDDSCVLVVISADQDPVTRSDANPDDLIVDTVSVWDKHVAHRNLQVTDLQSGGTRAPGTKGGSRSICTTRMTILTSFRWTSIAGRYRPARTSTCGCLAASIPPADSRVLIPARSRVRARLAVALPNTVKPGSASVSPSSSARESASWEAAPMSSACVLL